MTKTALSPNADTDGESGVMHVGHIDRASRAGKVIFAIALIFSAFQIYTAAYAPLSSQVTRAFHVGFVLLLIFGLTGSVQGKGPLRQAMNWAVGLIALGTGFYQYVFETDLILRAGTPSLTDMVVGIIAIVLVFEGARRLMGIALPIICALFICYALFGQYLPSPLNHRGYAFEQVVDQLGMGTEGIYGIPTYVSATYIFLFIVFGSFLERAGIITLFSDLAIGAVGHTKGGPAKVAVLSSALMGTVNGSGVANVVTTGQFTIPLMKRSGFTSAFSGAVEATSSMGGQIMPPVMGAVAFIMAETLDVPYTDVVKAAIVPALLYFAAAFWMVHLEASRLGLAGLKREELPSIKKAFKERWYLLAPLMGLVYLLFSGYTPLFAGTIGLAFTAILILGLPISGAFTHRAAKFMFWILLGISASGFFKWGVDVVFIIIGALIAFLIWRKGGRQTLNLILEALTEGARNALPVAIACALVGVIIGTMTLTGAATNFARFIIDIGEHSLFLSLVLTMLTCLVLGMGIPTIPNYIITSSLVGPALLGLGVPLIVSHMFVFYFGIMADLTPPVALAAFAASPIAKASGLRIGMNCMRIAIAGFVTPFMAVYTPALMLQDGGPLAEEIGYIPAVAYIITKAVIAIALWGAAAIGYLGAKLSWPERIWATAGAFCLVAAVPITDEIGFAASLSFVVWVWFKARRRRTATPA